MAFLSINTCFLVVYAGVFIQQCTHRRQWAWLISSVAVWLVLGVGSAWMLPGWGGPLKWGNLFLCHFYVFAGSMIALLTRRYARSQTSLYLDLLLRSGVVLHVSWLVLFGVAWWQYPQGLSAIFANRLIQMYLWQPAFWLSSQWLLMLLWWLAGLVGVEKGQPGRQTWQIGLLLALLWQAAYCFIAV